MVEMTERPTRLPKILGKNKMILFDWRSYLENKIRTDFFKYTVIGGIVTLMNIFFTWLLIDIIKINTVIATTSVIMFLHAVKFYSYRISNFFGRRQMGHIQFIIYTAVVVFCSILNIVFVWFLVDILHISTIISVTSVVVGLFLLRFMLFKFSHLIDKERK
jgi:putative flippase GtrA